MSSVQSGSSRQPIRRFVSSAPFFRDIFAYEFVTSPYPRGTLTANIPGANARSCPAGRVLRESGKKLYPVVNPGVSTYMISVIDTQSGISGFIDPNSPVFALYSTDLSVAIKDGVDPGPQGKKDVGPPLYTNGNLYVAGNGVIDGKLTVNRFQANDATIRTGRFSTMSGKIFDADEATVSSLLGGNLIVSSTESQAILASTIESGHVEGVTGRFVQLATSNFQASSIGANSIAADLEIAGSSIYAINLRASNGEIVNLETRDVCASTLKVQEILALSTIFSQKIFATSSIYGDISSINGSINDLITSTISARAIAVSDSIEGSTIYSVNISSLNGLFDNITGNQVRTSTIGAVGISTSSLGVSQELDASTINSLNISSINGLFDNLSASSINMSTLNADEIYAGQITVSTLNTSSITNEGIIVSRGQIRASGPSGQRIPITVSSLVELDVSNGPFFYLDGNGNYTVTCENFNFCDQMYIQTNGNGGLTFSTGFGVSETSMSTSQGIISFICDGFHMIELSRSKWAHTF